MKAHFFKSATFFPYYFLSVKDTTFKNGFGSKRHSFVLTRNKGPFFVEKRLSAQELHASGHWCFLNKSSEALYLKGCRGVLGTYHSMRC